MRIGSAAAEALMAGEDGRYMRALKSVLGTALFHESRVISGRRQTLSDIVTAFLAALKTRAEAHAGREFLRVLSGRPVHFHSSDPTRDARAEADLRACYLAAGFTEVDLFLEPEAAALASHGLGRNGELGLIVDIGGGTSDFTVYRTESGGLQILASHGIRLGGTDFDYSVSMTHAMPLLGHGSELHRSFGPGLLPVPNAIYSDLATWARIPFLYSPKTQRAVADLVRHAVAPEVLARLGKVIERQLGHEIAFAVEAGKIAANVGETSAQIDLGDIEPGLFTSIDSGSLNDALNGFRGRLREAMQETLRIAASPPEKVASVVLVGGSSLMGMISAEVSAVCPRAELHRSEAFMAVVDGLAWATGNSFPTASKAATSPDQPFTHEGIL